MTQLHKQVFVAATGTDIGKTYVTGALIRHLRATGIAACALKPVISGFEDDNIAESDTGQLLAAMDRPPTPDEAAKISPWRLRAALSPDMAAARENRHIEIQEVTNFCRQDANRSDADITFIEGVGGIMVPLNASATTLDWQVALNIPCLLVIGSYLGTMSHCLTALDTLSAKGIMPLAVILNESPQSPVPLAETAASLIPFVNDIPIVPLPRNGAFSEQDRVYDLLTDTRLKS
ncbi:MAG: dethiobiotin synthase [Parvibaculales bacterium]